MTFSSGSLKVTPNYELQQFNPNGACAQHMSSLYGQGKLYKLVRIYTQAAGGPKNAARRRILYLQMIYDLTHERLSRTTH